MKLIRFKRTSTETIGALIGNGRCFYILEPSWNGNRRNVSCIPAGRYNVKHMARSASGKYRNCYHVQNVPGRSAILIHCGNVHNNTRGCLLPGKRIGVLSGKNAVLNSRSALSEMVQLLGDEFELEVIDAMVS